MTHISIPITIDEFKGADDIKKLRKETIELISTRQKELKY